MAKVYGYCRVSHEDSTESGLGIEAQIYSIRNWWNYQQEAGRFVDHNWSPTGWKGEKHDGNQTGDGLFIDQSVSAFKTRLVKRPAGGRLEAILRPGDIVVFARLDRAFRGVADFAVTVERWMKRGILIQFVNPQVDLTTAYGMAFAQVAAVFAQLESAIKSERLKEAQARGRERGQKMGRHASFGWKQDGWTTRIVEGVAKQVPVMVPDEEERQEIARLVKLRAAGHSFATIAEMLELEIAVRQGRDPWPRAPLRGSENRRWDQNRVYKAYKARKRVPTAASASCRFDEFSGTLQARQ